MTIMYVSMPMRQGGETGKSGANLTTRPLLPQHDRSALIEADDVERVLTDVDPDYADRLSCCRKHGVLLGFATTTTNDIRDAVRKLAQE